MRLLLPLLALSVLVLAIPAWGEDETSVESERAALRARAEQLIQQGAADYERLREARDKVEAQKAAMGATGSLAQRDALMRRATGIETQMTELMRARSRLEDAKGRFASGRLDAAKVAFNDAVAKWSAVHEKIEAFLGPAPAARPPQPVRPATVRPTPVASSELEALRAEIRALRDEIQALRKEVRELKSLVKPAR